MLLCSNELFLAYIEARPGLIPILVTEDRQTARVIRQNENPAPFPRRGLGSPHGVGDTKGYVTGAPFRKLTGAAKVPHGTSGADSPRAYFPGSIGPLDASVLGIEIASASPAAALNSTT